MGNRKHDEMLNKIVVHKIKVKAGQYDVSQRFPKIDETDAKELLDQFHKGSELAFEKLCDMFIHPIAYAYQKPTAIKGNENRPMLNMNFHDKEDHFQNILLEFFLMLKSYDEKKGKLTRYINKSLMWNLFNKHIRNTVERSKTETLQSESDDTEDSCGLKIIDDLAKYEPQKQLDEMEVRMKFLPLYQALQDLSPSRKKVLELHYFQSMTLTDIAKHLGKSDSTIRNTKRQGLKQLEKVLDYEDYHDMVYGFRKRNFGYKADKPDSELTFNDFENLMN